MGSGCRDDAIRHIWNDVLGDASQSVCDIKVEGEALEYRIVLGELMREHLKGIRINPASFN